MHIEIHRGAQQQGNLVLLNQFPQIFTNNYCSRLNDVEAVIFPIDQTKTDFLKM